MKHLKYLLIGALMLVGATDIYSQLAVRYPTNVRYIGGGYINQRPQFSTLEAALNDVKPYATVNNPYVFWVASDTIQIVDWDSVFTESGLTMKDSIDVYYVAEGKIKWAGFGFGGTGGTGSTPIPTQTQTTTHYDYPNWDQNNAVLAAWIRFLAQGVDSIDQHIFDLIVYTDSSFLYIENDTLKFRSSALSAFGARPDTTLIVYKAGTETITGNKTFSGDMNITGSVRIPDTNQEQGVSRVLWAASNNLYWSHSGAAGDSGQVAMLNTDTGLLRNSNVVDWDNLTTAVKDSFSIGGMASFSGTNSSVDVPVTGMEATSVVLITPVYADSSTAIDAQDFMVVVPYSGGFYLKRSLAGTSGLDVNWAWIRKFSD